MLHGLVADPDERKEAQLLIRIAADGTFFFDCSTKDESVPDERGTPLTVVEAGDHERETLWIEVPHVVLKRVQKQADIDKCKKTAPTMKRYRATWALSRKIAGSDDMDGLHTTQDPSSAEGDICTETATNSGQWRTARD